MDITAKITSYIEGLFAQVRPTTGSEELKEELIANAMERYRDAMENGLTNEEAFEQVTSSIGNIDELVAQVVLEERGILTPEERRDARQKRAVLSAIASSLFIIAMLLALGALFGIFPRGTYVAAAILCVIPIPLLVYSSTMYPSYESGTASVVNDFREWNHQDKRNRSLRGSITSLLWFITIALYFVISFSTMAWHVTWIIFIIAAAVQQVISIIFNIKGR